MLSLLKKNSTNEFCFGAAKDQSRTDPGEKKFSADFFLNSTFCSNFLEKFWCDFFYFYIFSTFGIMFRMCMNFSGIVGAVMIFQ